MKFYFFIILLSLQAFVANASSFSAIYLINGDSDLSYYDFNGNKEDGGDNAFGDAKSVALACQNCEITIFRYFPDGGDKAFYFRNGKSVEEISFSRKESGYDLGFEQEWFASHTDGHPERRALLYFGHWIPEISMPYFRSSPDELYNINRFARGIQSFLPKGTGFDFTVLSTCYNGSPRTAMELKNLTHYLIASPAELNLKMMSTTALQQFEIGASVEQVAHSIVDESFKSITAEDETEVALAAYDFGEFNITPNLQSYLLANSERTNGKPISFQDCATYNLELPTPYFHFQANHFLHAREESSGWECEETS